MVAAIMIHARDGHKVSVDRRHHEYDRSGYPVISIDCPQVGLTIFPDESMVDDLIAKLAAYREANPVSIHQKDAA